MTSVAIVGNSALSQRQRKEIDVSDHIIRFNLTPNISNEPSARTTELFLSCSSKQVGSFLSERRFMQDVAFQRADRIVLPYHPEVIASYMLKPSWLSRLKGRKSDWSEVCSRAVVECSKELETVSVQRYLYACRVLGIDCARKDYFPSSGFIATLRALDMWQSQKDYITLFGFGFTGWKKHLWTQEKEVILNFKSKGQILISDS